MSTGRITALKASRALEIRTRNEQLPEMDTDVQMLELIKSTFDDKPTAFEGFAAEITRLGLGSIPSIDLTRPSRDGGRDAIGTYQIGTGASAVLVEFAMEAKCYSAKNSVGVKEIARLISRLRHRQFGVLVTTSYVNSQAYREIKEDGHPIVVISGTDIVRTLRDSGIGDAHDLGRWLLEHFPLLRRDRS